MAPESVAVAGASRPHPHEVESGDRWAVHWYASACRIIVADGLGHGRSAALAAEAVVERLARAPAARPAEALRLCHQALSRTRGAAVCVVWIDTEQRRLTYAGIGNVEGRLWQPPPKRSSRFVMYRGIVGFTVPTPREFQIDLSDEWLLVLHTDGVSSRWHTDGPLHRPLDPATLADQILNDWRRPTDDATVVIATPAGS